MNLIKFIVVASSEEPVEVMVNPKHVETIIDGKPFKQGDITQITMVSGSKFFVKHNYTEVKRIFESITKE